MPCCQDVVRSQYYFLYRSHHIAPAYYFNGKVLEVLEIPQVGQRENGVPLLNRQVVVFLWYASGASDRNG